MSELSFVITRTVEDAEELTEKLKRALEGGGEKVSIEQLNAWKGSLKAISFIDSRYPIIMEYPIFSLERPDFIIVGKDRALVVEAKGWRKIERINDYSVMADGTVHVEPCYQLKNYISKLKLFHSASDSFEFKGVLYTYNTNYTDGCTSVSSEDDLKRQIDWLGQPADESDLYKISKGHFTITRDLISLLRDNKEKLLKNAAKALLDEGYGLSSEQIHVVETVIEALKNGEKRVLIVNGESGSGKTLVALTMLFEAVTRGYRALIAYRNNRLLNTLRRILEIEYGDGSDLSELVQFYSTGGKANFTGIGEQNFHAENYGKLDLIIFDEAQRMTEDVIRLTTTRGRVLVYLYDETQILIGDEAGTRENFIKYLQKPEEAHLSAPYRAPRAYIDSVRKMFDFGKISTDGYDFRIFDRIQDMLQELKSRIEGGSKVALLCSFTESEGDHKDPKSIKNLRIGYPLQSGFELYKNSKLNIRWLMNEKTEYPKYWMGNFQDPLEHCSSVYGAQGFEAKYVGLVWGRDYVWRENGWQVQPQHITDRIGGRFSLQSIARRDQEKAAQLLKNRYYIMLTRGIKGTFVFFEDSETGKHVRELIQ